jgi:hypothetical protein
MQRGVTPKIRFLQSRLGLWLGGLLLGVACVQARSSSALGSAGATIVAEETFDLMPESVLITELTLPDGPSVQVETATTTKGLVLIRLSSAIPPDAAQARSDGAAPLGKGPNSGPEWGSIGQLRSARNAQNALIGDGWLSGEMVVTVSAPLANSGTLGDKNPPSLRITVEFN